MTDEHKEAIREGKKQNKAVGEYLERLEEARRPGRRKSPERIEERLAGIEDRLERAAPLDRLRLLQEQEDLFTELNTIAEGGLTPEIEKEFVTYAKAYGDRLGISYATWRKAGVPAEILKKAGIPRT